jgi:hypothetical protein
MLSQKVRIRAELQIIHFAHEKSSAQYFDQKYNAMRSAEFAISPDIKTASLWLENIKHL